MNKFIIDANRPFLIKIIQSINQITRLTLVNTSIKTLATGVLTVALITPLLALLLRDCLSICVPVP
jgi:hypothetical protein